MSHVLANGLKTARVVTLCYVHVDRMYVFRAVRWLRGAEFNGNLAASCCVFRCFYRFAVCAVLSAQDVASGHLLACAMCATGCCFGSIASVCDVGMGLGVEGGVQVVRFVVTGNHRMFNPRLLCLYAACPSMAMALGRHWRRKLEPVDGEYIFEELTNDIHMAQNKRAKAATQSCVSLQVCVLLWP